MLVDGYSSSRGMERERFYNVLDSTRVEVGLIDVHDGEGAGVIVALLLFGDLLASEIVGQGPRRRGAHRRRFELFQRRHDDGFCGFGSDMCVRSVWDSQAKSSSNTGPKKG